MARPDTKIPRKRWIEYFQRISDQACGTPTIVDEPAKPAAEAGVTPLPLRRIDYLAAADEVAITVGDEDAATPETSFKRLPHPVAVWVDAAEPACPHLIVIRSAAVPTVMILLLDDAAPRHRDSRRLEKPAEPHDRDLAMSGV
ncbi:MAG: hypothetical protein GEU78_16865 [Actinobacteria bacterium]|nr:hypothetical protein [Actinomycetota bacterium]